jgi:hypothetical protein
MTGRASDVWKRQLVGQAEYDLARRWLRASYRFREAIRRFRNPLQTGAELAAALERFKGKNPQTEESPYVRAIAVYDLRWDRFSEEFSAFEAESLEAEVMWGKSAQELRRSFQDLARELWRNMMIHLESEKAGTGPTKAINQIDRQTVDSVIYGYADLGDPGLDSFGDRVTTAVHALEQHCRKFLKR